MKISVSLTERDVAALDAYAREAGLASRSAAVAHAIDQLRHRDLESAYAQAWKEWDESPDASLWEARSGDGLSESTP